MNNEIFYGIEELEGSHDFSADDRMLVVAFCDSQERDLWVAGWLEEPRLMTSGGVRRIADRDEAVEACEAIEVGIHGDGAGTGEEALAHTPVQSYSDREIAFAREMQAELEGPPIPHRLGTDEQGAALYTHDSEAALDARGIAYWADDEGLHAKS